MALALCWIINHPELSFNFFSIPPPLAFLCVLFCPKLIHLTRGHGDTWIQVSDTEHVDTSNGTWRDKSIHHRYVANGEVTGSNPHYSLRVTNLSLCSLHLEVDTIFHSNILEKMNESYEVLLCIYI